MKAIILQALRDGSSMAWEIAERHPEIKRRKVTQILRELAEAGTITRRHRGVYAIPPVSMGEKIKRWFA